ncbi:MAG TPA: GAF domain-containing protein, partial [Gammaproteobacteria bacterium]|nr:GAF domain-containing protein [Gammaproteobacteria bacterium]
HSSITWLVTTPYLVAALALVVAQRRALGAHRLRMQWMMWSLVPFTIGILARAIPALGRGPAIMLNSIGVSIGVTGILYAMLRHRVVDVRVALDRTLVYGATTSLVVGVVAAMNSLALKATLGEGAGLLLQIVVPLALGIVLGKVRAYMDRIVERVFFRRRYLTEKALRTFAKRCGHIEEMPKLLDAAVAEIRKHTLSPAVALYELAEGKLLRLRSAGGDAYPAELDQDDPAVVALRAERKPVDLAGLESGLGSGGCVFPVTIVGRLRGVMVLADRPEERYGTDEKKLLAQVIREVGAAWRILRARDNEDLVRALARGTLEPFAARDRAQALEASWAKA